MKMGLHLSAKLAAALVLAISGVAAQAAEAIWQSKVLDDHTVILSAGDAALSQFEPSLMLAASHIDTQTLSPIVDAVSSPWYSLSLNANGRCLSLTDAAHAKQALSELCIESTTNQRWKLSLSKGGIQQVYGLGQQHNTQGEADGDWLGRKRLPGSRMGNAMVYQGEGAVGNTQIPIMYLLGEGKQNIALFFDHIQPLVFDFTKQPYQIQGKGQRARIIVIAGDNLADLRARYLTLTGKPPVPPKAMFGLWLSEYGFDNWQELDDKLATLQQAKFPLSGVVMDLQWFGGIRENSNHTQMGSLTWDEKNFPAPKQKIADLKQRGIRVMAIEEPYIGGALNEFQSLAHAGALARSCPPPCMTPAKIKENPWWGKGGMLDFSSEKGAAFWHDYRREALIDDGIIAHWTDLGEPELYHRKAWYAGVKIDGELKHDHQSVHNLYNLLWSRSIYQGYLRNQRNQRPFIMSRSGTAGSQAYGVAMWSGDIGVNLANLRSHFNAQMHMSLSGIDYFGSDIGGFHGTPWDEQYTQWLAAALFTDLPVRPHTQNLCNCKETAPDRIGDTASNLFNVQQRYALNPYYYTLAHRAWRNGTAVVAPLVYGYQEDVTARTNGSMKLVGDAMLVALEAKDNAKHTQAYLPQGLWYDYRSQQMLNSGGEYYKQPLYIDGVYRLPLFVKAGALIPRANEDETIDLLVVLDERGHARGELIEDDGESIAYQQQQWQFTEFSAQTHQQHIGIQLSAAKGSYAKAPTHKAYQVELANIPPQTVVKNVSFEGEQVTQWQQHGHRLILGMQSIDVEQGGEWLVEFAE
ncbi:TIM-barrel domain-containing protein [Agarivorans sp. 1_MG-2023]|uniref:glycoside hydrolase family 31 protein n=1 Tax=Agarivorans sp. 1_MG-2023 TaxID=3062634 RepID=UPI0026E34B18|nr:TIM-barrel domain-containing protein [Agarivorans sp. 1_MG-2023]MDO6763377.1 glycoside hydrolase family 31 protein [Agarivorans sp. 1_MG-2023]